MDIDAKPIVWLTGAAGETPALSEVRRRDGEGRAVGHVRFVLNPHLVHCCACMASPLVRVSANREAVRGRIHL